MKWIFILLICLLTPSLWADETQEINQTIEKFLKIRTPTKPTFDDQGRLYSLDFPNGTLQLYRVEANQVATASQPMKQISQFQDGISSYTISPDGKQIIMSAAKGGNERTQLYELQQDEVKHLIGSEKVVTTFQLWRPDSQGFFYISNQDNLKDFHIYYWDSLNRKSHKLLEKTGQWFVSAISKDFTKVLIQEMISASDSKVYEMEISDLSLDPKTRPLKNLSIHHSGQTASNHAVAYLDSESVLILSDQNGNMQLYRKDLNSPQISHPLPKLNNYEIDQALISFDQKYLSLLINEDGYATLKLFLLPNLEEIKLPTIAKGVIASEPIRNHQIIWTLSNAQSPNVSYLWEIGSSQTAKQISFPYTSDIDLSAFPLPELIQYESFDGLKIPAFLYLPPNYPKDPQKRYPIPFVVNYHGGPESQFRPYFDRNSQILLKMGFGIIQPNVRGSTGYGRHFHMLDDYKNRWHSVKDGYLVAKWLVEQKYATAGKIATYGGSYGGFMSIACLLEDSLQVKSGKERLFGAGIDVVGIVNLKTFLEQTADYRRKLREVEYGPLSDEAFLKSVSSIHQIDEIAVNLMIAHGLNDPRVPVGEAMQLAVAMQRRGFDPELLYFPDEGHGFAKLPNRILFTNRLIRFLRRELIENKQPLHPHNADSHKQK